MLLWHVLVAAEARWCAPRSGHARAGPGCVLMCRCACQASGESGGVDRASEARFACECGAGRVQCGEEARTRLGVGVARWCRATDVGFWSCLLAVRGISQAKRYRKYVAPSACPARSGYLQITHYSGELVETHLLGQPVGFKKTSPKSALGFQQPGVFL